MWQYNTYGGKPMDKSTVQTQMDFYIKQREQISWTILGLNGAIEDCKYWLATIADEEAKNVPPEATADAGFPREAPKNTKGNSHLKVVEESVRE